MVISRLLLACGQTYPRNPICIGNASIFSSGTAAGGEAAAAALQFGRQGRDKQVADLGGHDTEGEPDEFSLAGFSGGPNEVWSFGDEVYKLITPLLHLRQRLRPYVMEQMRTAHEDGLPPMRAMLLEFPDDAEVWALADQFMFGPDLLVAPILEPGATVDVLQQRKDLDPEAYAGFAAGWVTRGAGIVGGCCEVGPAHIALLAKRFKSSAGIGTGQEN